MATNWQGVFPAVTTQYKTDYSLDLEAMQVMLNNLVDDGVHGIIALGTVGENYSLEPEEKLQVLAAAKEAIAGRVPLLTGVAETTTDMAVKFSQAAARVGVDGLMLLPGLVYQSNRRETIEHFKTVGQQSELPIMIYNNPVSYGVDLTVDMLAELVEIESLVAIKESSTMTNRLIDLQNAFADRFTLFCGVDDIALESLALGADGWVSGLTNVFPEESVALYQRMREGDLEGALAIYRWFMPLLHLDTIPTLVQCIKLAEQLVGRGSERIRAPRLELTGDERLRVTQLIEKALATRPDLG